MWIFHLFLYFVVFMCSDSLDPKEVKILQTKFETIREGGRKEIYLNVSDKFECDELCHSNLILKSCLEFSQCEATATCRGNKCICELNIGCKYKVGENEKGVANQSHSKLDIDVEVARINEPTPKVKQNEMPIKFKLNNKTDKHGCTCDKLKVKKPCSTMTDCKAEKVCDGNNCTCLLKVKCKKSEMNSDQKSETGDYQIVVNEGGNLSPMAEKANRVPSLKLFQLPTKSVYRTMNFELETKKLVYEFPVRDDVSLKTIQCKTAVNAAACQSSAMPKCNEEAKKVCPEENKIQLCRYAFLSESTRDHNCCYKINCIEMDRPLSPGRFLMEINGQSVMINNRGPPPNNIPKLSNRRKKSHNKNLSHRNSTNEAKSKLNKDTERSSNSSEDENSSDEKSKHKIDKRSSDDIKTTNSSNQKVFVFELAKDECIQKCHSKPELTIAAEMCGKRSISCTAKHDCPSMEVCSCDIAFTCDESSDLSDKKNSGSKTEDIDEIFQSFKGMEPGAVKSSKANLTAKDCSNICESPKINERICKYGSACDVKSDCNHKEYCGCSITIKCLKPGKKSNENSEDQKLKISLETVKDGTPGKTVVFQNTTSDQCSKVCKNKILTKNFCGVGLSCRAKSVCLKSVEGSCNCSVSLKCKPNDGKDSGSSKGEDSSKEDRKNEKDREKKKDDRKIEKDPEKKKDDRKIEKDTEKKKDDRKIEKDSEKKKEDRKIDKDPERHNNIKIDMDSDVKKHINIQIDKNPGSSNEDIKIHKDLEKKKDDKDVEKKKDDAKIDKDLEKKKDGSKIDKDPEKKSDKGAKFDSKKKALESLKGMKPGREKLVFFNTSKEDCHSTCYSPGMRDLCPTGASCRVKSTCDSKSYCVCSLRIRCNEEETDNISEKEKTEKPLESSKILGALIRANITGKSTTNFVTSRKKCKSACVSLKIGEKICSKSFSCTEETDCSSENNCTCTITLKCSQVTNIGKDLSQTSSHDEVNFLQFKHNKFDIKKLVTFLKNQKAEDKKVAVFNYTNSDCVKVCRDLENEEKVCVNGATCHAESECSPKDCKCNLTLKCKSKNNEEEIEKDKNDLNEKTNKQLIIKKEQKVSLMIKKESTMESRTNLLHFESRKFDPNRIVEFLNNQKSLNVFKSATFNSTKEQCLNLCKVMETKDINCFKGSTCRVRSKCHDKDCVCTLTLKCKNENSVKEQKEKPENKFKEENESKIINFEGGKFNLKKESNLQFLESYLRSKTTEEIKKAIFSSTKEDCLGLCKGSKIADNICKSGSLCRTNSVCEDNQCNCTLTLQCKKSSEESTKEVKILSKNTDEIKDKKPHKEINKGSVETNKEDDPIKGKKDDNKGIFSINSSKKERYEGSVEISPQKKNSDNRKKKKDSSEEEKSVRGKIKPVKDSISQEEKKKGSTEKEKSDKAKLKPEKDYSTENMKDGREDKEKKNDSSEEEKSEKAKSKPEKDTISEKKKGGKNKKAKVTDSSENETSDEDRRKEKNGSENEKSGNDRKKSKGKEEDSSDYEKSGKVGKKDKEKEDNNSEDEKLGKNKSKPKKDTGNEKTKDKKNYKESETDSSDDEKDLNHQLKPEKDTSSEVKKPGTNRKINEQDSSEDEKSGKDGKNDKTKEEDDSDDKDIGKDKLKPEKDSSHEKQEKEKDSAVVEKSGKNREKKKRKEKDSSEDDTKDKSKPEIATSDNKKEDGNDRDKEEDNSDVEKPGKEGKDDKTKEQDHTEDEKSGKEKPPPEKDTISVHKKKHGENEKEKGDGSSEDDKSGKNGENEKKKEKDSSEDEKSGKDKSKPEKDTSGEKNKKAKITESSEDEKSGKDGEKEKSQEEKSDKDGEKEKPKVEDSLDNEKSGNDGENEKPKVEDSSDNETSGNNGENKKLKKNNGSEDVTSKDGEEDKPKEDDGSEDEKSSKSDKKDKPKEDDGSEDEKSGKVGKKDKPKDDDTSVVEKSNKAGEKYKPKKDDGSEDEESSNVDKKDKPKEDDGSEDEKSGKVGKKDKPKGDDTSVVEKSNKAGEKDKPNKDDGSEDEESSNVDKKDKPKEDDGSEDEKSGKVGKKDKPKDDDGSEEEKSDKDAKKDKPKEEDSSEDEKSGKGEEKRKSKDDDSSEGEKSGKDGKNGKQKKDEGSEDEKNGKDVEKEKPKDGDGSEDEKSGKDRKKGKPKENDSSEDGKSGKDGKNKSAKGKPKGRSDPDISENENESSKKEEDSKNDDTGGQKENSQDDEDTKDISKDDDELDKTNSETEKDNKSPDDDTDKNKEKVENEKEVAKDLNQSSNENVPKKSKNRIQKDKGKNNEDKTDLNGKDEKENPKELIEEVDGSSNITINVKLSFPDEDVSKSPKKPSVENSNDESETDENSIDGKKQNSSKEEKGSETSNEEGGSLKDKASSSSETPGGKETDDSDSDLSMNKHDSGKNATLDLQEKSSDTKITGKDTSSQMSNQTTSLKHDCRILCNLTSFDKGLCESGFSCKAKSQCTEDGKCNCVLVLACLGINHERVKSLQKNLSKSKKKSGKDKREDQADRTKDEIKAIESLKDINMRGKKTVSFNASYFHCSELCESPKLAQETCQYGSSCKVKSSQCTDKSFCNCSLTLTCHEVSLEFKNLVSMKDDVIKKQAKANLQVSKKGSVTSVVKFRVNDRNQCSDSCKPMIAGSCGNQVILNATQANSKTVQQGGKCKFVFQCTGREVHEICMCSVKATCDRDSAAAKTMAAKTSEKNDSKNGDVENDYSTINEDSKSKTNISKLDSKDVKTMRAMNSSEIVTAAKANLTEDGSSQVRFRVQDSSECAASCNSLIEGACGNYGGVCDFVYQCTRVESKKVCICSTKGVCHPKNSESAKMSLDKWKTEEKNNTDQIMYEFSSSKNSSFHHQELYSSSNVIQKITREKILDDSRDYSLEDQSRLKLKNSSKDYVQSFDDSLEATLQSSEHPVHFSKRRVGRKKNVNNSRKFEKRRKREIKLKLFSNYF